VSVFGPGNRFPMAKKVVLVLGMLLSDFPFPIKTDFH